MFRFLQKTNRKIKKRRPEGRLFFFYQETLAVHHFAVESRYPGFVLSLGRNLEGRNAFLDLGLEQGDSVQIDKGEFSAQIRMDFKAAAVQDIEVGRGQSAEIIHANIHYVAVVVVRTGVRRRDRLLGGILGGLLLFPIRNMDYRF